MEITDNDVDETVEEHTIRHLSPKLRCTDTSAARHFGSRTLRQQRNTAEVSRHFGSTADVSYGLFGSAAKVSARVASDDVILSLYFVFVLCYYSSPGVNIYSCLS